MSASKNLLEPLKAAYFEWTKLDGSMDELAYAARDRFDDLVRNSFPELVEEIEREDRFRSSKFWAWVVQMEAVVEAAREVVDDRHATHDSYRKLRAALAGMDSKRDRTT